MLFTRLNLSFGLVKNSHQSCVVNPLQDFKALYKYCIIVIIIIIIISDAFFV